METITSKSQDMERIVTWKEIKEIIKDWDKNLKYYGVPRGGQYISALLNPVDTPEEADVIVDDLIDSGKTKEKYLKYNKPFKVLFENQNEWLVFPWEQSGVREIEDNVLRIIQYFDKSNREGLKETPKRYVKFLTEFLTKDEFNFTTFENDGDTDEMIIQKNIPFFSLCEHHLAPFFGMAHVAYIPNDRIVGLSKLARTVKYYAQDFQNQERITSQVAERLQKELNCKGVAVSLTARHFCMEMRGIKTHHTETITTKLLGTFKIDTDARSEFLSFCNK